MHIPTKPIHLPTKLSINKLTDGVAKINIHSREQQPHSNGVEQEMVINPKTRPRASSDLEKVKEQLDNAEAKCLYCGRKMESILEELQGQIEELELSEEMETIVYIDLAALKQIRDLLLHKIPFSGELSDYEALTSPPAEKDEQKIVELFEEPTEQNDGSVPDDKLSSSLDVVES